MTQLSLDIGVHVGQGDDAFALEAKLELDAGTLVLFGPSGSGKSLTLQALVGLVRPMRGRIAVAGRALFDASHKLWVPPHRRHIGYVPQHHSLFPFCSVRDNVAFGLSRAERRGGSKVVEALIDELGLGHLANQRPHSLSGGERQRVALARALAVDPVLLVLDEPFASIDADGRSELRATLRRTLGEHAMSAVFVTHDRDEALELGDRAVRFERGRTVASGVPADVL
jgi:molybdate transport system ATP-binding protein